MTKRRLPIGIQTFREIREQNCYYIDKTAYIYQLLNEGKHYFLSRPRRFGKSLFLDTLKELFEGNEPLFEGLYIHDHWDWQVRYPVLRLSFGSGNFSEPGILHKEVMAQLDAIEAETGVESHYDTASARFRHIIQMLHSQAGQRVAILVDEYDKPILDTLEEPDIANFEGYYASVFYSYFAGLGLDIIVEDSSNHGRLDMAVHFNGNIYLFEFKVVEMASEGAAMAQLKEKRYADKYRGLDQPIHLIAVEFSKNTRNITAFEVEIEGST